MVNVFIDNIAVEVYKNSTVLQACDKLGIDVPRFCFHERLLIAGNCRMCLVEIEKSPKPVASCALPVAEGMKIFTKTPLVKKAQEGVLEFLLLNHPLDCPICDQAGECDLQDQVMLFGSDSSRFYGIKRAVEDKNCGPFINTIMTRCIHCTRCVRFSIEIAGVPDLGTLGRGTNTQIGTYIEKSLKSELSGNLVDLCPVGALTSKVYAFEGRPWELISTNSIDVSDSCGSNIVVNSKGNNVLRILPRVNDNINEEWLSDKGRFLYDGLSIQRLFTPVYFNQLSKKNEFLDWEKSFNIFLLNIYKDVYNLDKKLNIVFGKDVDLETILVLKHFFNKLNCFSLYSDLSYCTNTLDLFNGFNSNIKNIENNDLCILVNCDTRIEASMLNLHLRKGVNKGKLTVGYFGPSVDLTFNTNHLGIDKKSFFDFLKGKHPFSKKLKKAKNPLFIMDSHSFTNKELLSIQDVLKNSLNLPLNCLNILDLYGGSGSLKEIGIQSINKLKNSKNNSFLLINTDFSNNKNLNFLKKSNFSVYCGSHGTSEANFVDLVLPSNSVFEQKCSFINLEGLRQISNKSISGTGISKDGWKIFTAFFDYLCLNSSYISILNQQKYINFFGLNLFLSKEFFLFNSKGYNKHLCLNVLVKGNTVFSNYLQTFKQGLINYYETSIMCKYSKNLLAFRRRKNFLELNLNYVKK